MNITTEQVKELRDQTGISIMQCKKALEEVGGDMEKALMILKKKSSEVAAKKSDREATDGLVVAKSDGNKVAMITVYCETDFVAKNDDFVKLSNDLADIALSQGVDAVKEKGQELVSLVVQKVGENIQIGDTAVVEGNVSGVYTHNGKSGVIVSLSAGTPELARDIAMHIAAMKPEFTNASEIPQDQKDRAKELFEKEVEESDKPADMKAKILQGKIDAYFKDLTLMDQMFVKDPSMSIKNLLDKNKAEIVKVVRQKI